MPPALDRLRQRRVSVERVKIDFSSFWTEVAGDRVEITEDGVEDRGKLKRVVTSVSELERFLPIICGVEDLSQHRESSRAKEEASIIGESLHGLHGVCNLIVHDNTGLRVRLGLPTANEETLRRMQQLTDGLYLTKEMSAVEIEQVLAIAWQRCFEMGQRVKPGTLPMFTGMNLSDPRKEEEYRHSERLFIAGLKFAKSWANLIAINPEGEFDPNSLSVNEVMVIVNSDSIQLKARLDTVTKINKKGEKVMFCLSDLKTGKGVPLNGFDAEVQKRQAQIMLYVAERFANHFLLGNKWLTQTGAAYVINAATSRWHRQSRCQFSYLRFNQETGGLNREVVEMSDEERIEFGSWLTWYGQELRGLKGR